MTNFSQLLIAYFPYFIKYLFCLRSECEAQVKGFPKARHKKFDKQEDAVAFINDPSQGVRLPRLSIYIYS